MQVRIKAAFNACAESDRRKGPDGLLTSEESERVRWRWIVGQVFEEFEDVRVVDRVFEDLFIHFARPESWRCFRDVAAAVARLDEAGLPMVIASNFDQRLHSVCGGWPPMQQARAVVVSSEVGWKKPGKGFYAALVQECGCRADQVLMVGDDHLNDFEGARHSGLQAVLLDRSARTVERHAASPRTSRPVVISSLSDLDAWYS